MPWGKISAKCSKYEASTPFRFLYFYNVIFVSYLCKVFSKNASILKRARNFAHSLTQRELSLTRSQLSYRLMKGARDW